MVILFSLRSRESGMSARSNRTSRLKQWRFNRKLAADRRQHRRLLLEQLGTRNLFASVPVALDDPWYDTAVNTDLIIGTSDQTLLDNDVDVDGDSLTTSVVANPAHGTLISFGTVQSQLQR
jgi:hypothetical protein